MSAVVVAMTSFFFSLSEQIREFSYFLPRLRINFSENQAAYLEVEVIKIVQEIMMLEASSMTQIPYSSYRLEEQDVKAQKLSHKLPV